MKRQSGILLPVYSLPSKYGFGSLGEEAYKFIDWLKDAGQSVWQILPIGPTTVYDSPYQCVSSFAGNPYFIDLDLLKEEGLLKSDEYENLCFGTDPQFADYEKLAENRKIVLRKAFERGKNSAEFEQFKNNEKSWLFDYSLYAAAKDYFSGNAWTSWTDESLKRRENSAIEKYSVLLKDDIDFYSFLQFKFYTQWFKLKKYANVNGISIMGDVPVYVGMDSADVWAWTQFFDLDENYLPREVAGVPPDYFNEDGQLWNNPLYNWDAMRNDGYGWWIRRIDASLRFCDILRIDHFRGFSAYWAVKQGEKTAKGGHWVKGPGYAFVKILTDWFGQDKFVAEDLGILDDDAKQLLKQSGLPGMKVLQFAFDADGLSSYLPHMYERNCICYTGTHDNNTAAAFEKEAKPEDLEFAKKYMNTNGEDIAGDLIRTGMSSVANLFVAQMQDYLRLPENCRTNTPGTVGCNWKWRLLPGELTDALSHEVYELTKTFGRI